MTGQLERFVDPVDGGTWEVDLGFLGSNWACIWDRGCNGILDHPAPELGEGCCSVGAVILDDDEGMRIAALAAALPAARFQQHAAARAGVFADEERRRTRLVGGACIFLNRPGFPGGAGCALHLGALDDGDEPIDWKPAVCWQLPLRVERLGDRTVLRRWERRDWGPGGTTMAWCCTEEPEAHVGERPVVESMAREIEAVVGSEVMVQIRTRLR